MESILLLATQWRGHMSILICLTVAYVAIRCLWAARKASGFRRRRLLACGLGAGAMAPLATAPSVGMLPILVAVALLLLAAACRQSPWLARPFTLVAAVLLASTSGLLAAGRIPTLAVGPSMWPTTSKSLSLLLMESGVSHLQRGSRVYFHVSMTEAGSDPETQWPAGRYHKRVIGLPGDRVVVGDYSISVNGRLIADCRPESAVAVLPGNKWLCEGHIRRSRGGVDYRMTWGRAAEWMLGRQSWTLGSGEVLVMGDNLVESGDSRQRGPIRAEWITGVVAR